METAMIGLEIARRMLFRAGPYLLAEIVLPGGTLVALALYLYRRHLKKSARPCRIDTGPNDYRAKMPHPERLPI